MQGFWRKSFEKVDFVRENAIRNSLTDDTSADDEVVLIEDERLAGGDTPDGSRKHNAIPVYVFDGDRLRAVADFSGYGRRV